MRQASAAVPGLTPATPTEIPSGYHLVTFDVVNAQAKGSVSLVYTDFALNKTVQLALTRQARPVVPRAGEPWSG